MRDYARIDGYLNKLAGDIYLQPEDDGHKNLSLKVISHWMSRLTSCKSVLDLGCGTGFCQPYFEQAGCSYEGICLGGDYLAAQELGRNVRKMDFSFLEYDDNSFDLLFSRHSLEPAQGTGILGMKIIGEGRFTTPEDRDASVKFVMKLGTVDAVTIGYKSPAEIDEAIERIDRHLKFPERAAATRLPARAARRRVMRGTRRV